MSDQTAIINRLIKNSAEIITEDDFRERLESGTKLTHYIGFEISGYVHIGQGIMSALVMKDLTDLGVKCTVWLADWHTWINNKLDGTKATAAEIGRGYFTEAIKAAYLSVGGDPADLEFRLASDWYQQNTMQYWETVLGVMNNTTQARLQRSISIMGRKEGSEVEGAKLMYPAMQVADIFYLNVDIAHAGMDQRKAHVVMRDVAPKVYPDRPKPIALHHPLLIGLKKPATWPIPDGTDQKDVIIEMKMSKSDPNSAIWVHDTPDEIAKKVNQAFCPEKEIYFNPILNWIGHILWWNRERPFRIERKPEHGGGVEFNSYQELEKAYANAAIHPMDLKAAVAQELITLLEPARTHFAEPDVAAKKADLDKILLNR
ncbi:MAG: tyrosine--tRNA ligase [Candidatus Andersenbacteria bacterium RIFCSPHIGHO2_12_FULL_46_9]|nr:MAG: Tyrosine-tRNA ligase [Parcubacteria group bacterium GW2011_GWA2_45_14]OGY33349.1 MAG: tyrosine--tRNA ligase [Candidatus Andersenbacteria bacterium RIFCSPHIGHO2_02_FULL_46_16]OGY35596.1 MAG: tyrosine--tRNA ligase [Candidatus Andersenbacteria bacterium RIFCSPHIGHO2_12_FULL_46_9]OGY36448.1 MAG: tyrosine--tRNA ligase [Candidatus Andersenbacteria bacterium RIFCSPLOWO2_02_FULL_46_11]OGY38509.1 MAG: tyrosine--tRNA ligase [Candidatus Andersenbacteria bacterium RIFCSPLOWO2_12_FULL_45_8]